MSIDRVPCSQRKKQRERVGRSGAPAACRVRRVRHRMSLGCEGQARDSDTPDSNLAPPLSPGDALPIKPPAHWWMDTCMHQCVLGVLYSLLTDPPHEALHPPAPTLPSPSPDVSAGPASPGSQDSAMQCTEGGTAAPLAHEISLAVCRHPRSRYMSQFPPPPGLQSVSLSPTAISPLSLGPTASPRLPHHLLRLVSHRGTETRGFPYLPWPNPTWPGLPGLAWRVLGGIAGRSLPPPTSPSQPAHRRFIIGVASLAATHNGAALRLPTGPGRSAA